VLLAVQLVEPLLLGVFPRTEFGGIFLTLAELPVVGAQPVDACLIGEAGRQGPALLWTGFANGIPRQHQQLLAHLVTDVGAGRKPTGLDGGSE
jgi:hypothetical protein